MNASLIMKKPVCQIFDSPDPQSWKDAPAPMTKFMLGEVSFYKGYEHINDELPVRELQRTDNLPADLDWRSEYKACFPDSPPSSIHSQSDCGSCWAFTSASAVTNTLCIAELRSAP